MNLSLKLYILEEKVEWSICNFKVGTCVLGYESCYKYIGVWFDEHLFFNTSEQSLHWDCQNRQEEHWDIHTIMFNACITPILDYSARVLGVW